MAKILLVALVFAVSTASPMAARAQNVDPLTIGMGKAPGALEGSYITGGEHLQFLVLAAPRGSSNAHLNFYNASCTAVSNRAVNLTNNDVALLPLHSPLVTPNRVGNFLLTAGDGPVIGWSYYVDISRGIGRLEELARLSMGAGSSNGWAPYRPAHVLVFAPPDDGVSTFVSLLFRCPVGTALQAPGGAGGTVVGTGGTLGGKMLDLASQQVDGATAGSVFGPDTTIADPATLCDDCVYNGLFAVGIAGNVYDLDENFLSSVDAIICRCLGASVAGSDFVNEIRLRDLAGAAGIESTYWELFSSGLFTVSQNLQMKVGALNMNFFSRLHNARDTDNIE